MPSHKNRNGLRSQGSLNDMQTHPAFDCLYRFIPRERIGTSYQYVVNNRAVIIYPRKPVP